MFTETNTFSVFAEWETSYVKAEEMWKAFLTFLPWEATGEVLILKVYLKFSDDNVSPGFSTPKNKRNNGCFFLICLFSWSY